MVDLIVDPVGMFERWLQFVGFHLVTIVWCAPFYTWTLLVSSAARSIPFIWFVGVPLALIVVDSMMITGELRGFIGRHTLPVGLDDEHVWSLSETVVLYATDWELLAAIVIAAVFVYLTVRMRGRADEI